MDFGQINKSTKISLTPSKNYNQMADAVKTIANISFNPRDFQVSKSMGAFLVSSNNIGKGFDRKINFDFEEIENGVTIYAGKVRIHGKRVISIVQTDVTITGGTESAPSFVYVNVNLATWAGTIQYSLTEPLSNNNEINVPLHAFAAASNGGGGGYDVFYLYTCYVGDIQLGNVIKD